VISPDTTIQAETEPAAALPPLPVEQHAVTAALALQEVRAKAEVLLWFLQNDPRSPHVAATFSELADACGRAYSSHLLHRELIDCRGQA